MTRTDWLALVVLSVALTLILLGVWRVMHSFEVETRLLAMAGILAVVTFVLLTYVIVGRAVYPSECPRFPCDPLFDDRITFRLVISFGGFSLSGLFGTLAIWSWALRRWRLHRST